VRVSIGDVRLFVEVFGQEWAFTGLRVERRPLLIGLHGGPGLDGTGLRYWLAPLAEVSQVIVPDQRGHGRSDAGTPETWNLPTWAADVRGLCDVLDIQTPVVLGNSFGGMVAQQYAISHPDNIAGLILISTAARLPAPEEVIARVRDVGGDEAAGAMRRDIENPTDETAAEVKRPCTPLYSRRATPDPAFAKLKEYFIRSPELISHWFPEAQRTLDLRPDLHAVRCPTLVLVGEHDPLNPPALAMEIVDAIPNGHARLELVPDAAHRVFADNPEHVYRRIRAFLSDLG
jgi:pimeloyl-ACP methyl ester carboxylesterase